MRNTVRTQRKRTGAAAAELAFLLPFLLLALFIAADYTRIFFYSQTLQNAAQQAAIYAGGVATPKSELDNEEAGRRAAVHAGQSLSPAVQKEQVSFTTTDDMITATVTYEFNTILRYPGFSQTIELNVAATAPIAPGTEE